MPGNSAVERRHHSPGVILYGGFLRLGSTGVATQGSYMVFALRRAFLRFCKGFLSFTEMLHTATYNEEPATQGQNWRANVLKNAPATQNPKGPCAAIVYTLALKSSLYSCFGANVYTI